jgi:hypothetical protein
MSEKRQNIEIGLLKLWDKNPRKILRRELDKLKKSIFDDGDFLDARPLLVNVVNNEFIVYAGNQRLKACTELGWKTVPCFVDIDLDDETMRKRAIRDNVNYGVFDIDLIRDLEFEKPFLEQMNIKVAEISFEVPAEVEFTREVMEANNYIILLFDNEMDWLSAESMFELSQAQALDSREDYQRAGIGRVVDGKKLLELLIEKKYEDNSADIS